MFPPRSRRLDKALNVEDLRRFARRRLPRFAFDYVDSAADDGVTAARNRTAYNAVTLLPRQLHDVSWVDTTARILGADAALPLAIAPTGYNGMLTHQGDLALARTARDMGIPFVQSTMSTSSIEEVAAAIGGGRHWFQLYVLKDPTILRRLIERAGAAGCEALVLTTDAVALGNREIDRRNYARPQVLRLTRKIDTFLHIDWLFDVLVPHGVPVFGNLTEFLPREQWSARDGARFIAGQMDASLDWKRVEAVRAAWDGKLVVKGLLRAKDACLACAAGADAIVVSNHGGRQLDCTPSPIDVLARVVEAVEGRCEILVDSGVRRGSDVFKALALGASGAMVGRAVLYGLAAGREAGARHAISILAEELGRTMALTGCARLKDIDVTLLARWIDGARR